MGLTSNLTSGLTSGLTGGIIPSSGAPVSPYLDGVLSGVEFELDAYDGDSYTSGQLWNNISTPASGAENKTKYSHYMGFDGTSEAQDPTFSVNKFTVDGSDHFSLKDQSDAPQFLKDMPKITSKWTGLFVLHIGATLASSDYFFGTGRLGAGSPAVAFGTTASGDLNVIQYDGSTLITATAATGLAINTTYLIGISVDLSLTTNNVRAWVNSATKNQTSQNFGTNITAGDGYTMLMARPVSTGNGVTQNMPNGDWISYAAMTSGFIDDADFALFDEYISTKHAIDYIP